MIHWRCFRCKQRLTSLVSAFTVVTILAGIIFMCVRDPNVFVNVNIRSTGSKGGAAVENPVNNTSEKESTYRETSSYSLQAMKDAMSKIFCNFTATEEMHIMIKKLPPFIERFKNPCWYEGTTLQCIPYMYIVGADKCGTTDLYKKISFHPDFVPPTRKEPIWMPVERFLMNSSLSYYVSKYFSNITDALSAEKESSKLITVHHRNSALPFPSISYVFGKDRAMFLFANALCDSNVFNLEGTPFWPFLGANIGHDEPMENTADHIYHLNSKAKILINIRNPIDKLWSGYLALSKTRNKSAERFHDIVVRGISLYNDCLQTRTVRSCMYDRALVQLTMMTKEEREERLNNCSMKPVNAVFLRNGVYHVFIKDYLKVFPRDQVLIQRLEDIAEDGKGSLFRTYKFLDLEIPSKARIKEILNKKVWNSRKPLNYLKGDMWELTRRILYDFYKPHNEQLASLLNHSKYNYGPLG